MKKERNFSNLDVIKFFIRELWEIKLLAFSSIIWIMFVTILWLIIPICFKEIVDIISQNWVDKVVMFVWVKLVFLKLSIVMFLIFISRRILDYIIPYCYEKIDYNISLEAFSYLHKHSYNFFINNFAWALFKKVWRLISSMQWLFDVLIWNFSIFFVSIVFVIIILVRENSLLWLLFFIWIFIFVSISIFLNKFRLPYIEKAANENSKVWWIYADTIMNNYNISTFWNLTRECQYIKTALDKWLKLEEISIKKSVLMYTILAVISILGQLLMIYVSIKFWFSWNISVWTFVLVLSFQSNISWQIFSLSNIFWKLWTHIWNSLEMLDILKTPHEIKDIENAKNLEVSKWKIEFKNVLFNYNKDVEVFKDFNLTINPWEKVWIVWASWSWKSSLIKLLFRFYDLKWWNILIDNQDISKVTQDSLRSQISIVPQDTILFHRSLKENIWYSKENPTEEEIISASKKANCHDFISKLKDGYDTLVWERWVKLSGWERQRVSIARAMLQDNKILVLDEATSALDSESEKLIQNALEKLMLNKTMIVIAHRLSTIMKMDRIVVMENGKIIEVWSHKELLEKSWVYKKLWDIQSGGFIGE